MQARTILTILALVFLAAAALRMVRERGRIGPAGKTWWLVGAIFAAVSVWLWTR